MLSWFRTLYGTEGFGIEALPMSVEWASRHSAGSFCLWQDHKNLAWVPDGSFDAIVSYWAFYHISRQNQCAAVRQLLAKLRPEGRMWIGGNTPSPALNIE